MFQKEVLYRVTRFNLEMDYLQPVFFLYCNHIKDNLEIKK